MKQKLKSIFIKSVKKKTNDLAESLERGKFKDIFLGVAMIGYVLATNDNDPALDLGYATLITDNIYSRVDN